ncbi:MAG TPA: catalase family protein [Pyrinomonadaceae bacterium]|nr:catalase family protein [Pyrinomonadaceae bacterium]
MKKTRLELYKEYPEPGEEELTARLVALMQRLVEKEYLTGTTPRATHAKGLVAARGEFTVEPDLPEELRVGLFREPRTYPCWMRFANLSPKPQADIKPDIRAVSFKLMGVGGERLWQDDEEARTLDLIMMGSKTFLAPDLPQFYDMEKAIDRGTLHVVWFMLTHPAIGYTIASSSRKCANVLEVPYWSQTAYAFGDRAVQYHMKPRRPATSRVLKPAANNYLRERLIEDLAAGEAHFDFFVQFQTDAWKMPIEKPIIPWDEKLSPYRKVASVRVLKQQCDTPARNSFCENISFNAWRTLPEHRPLGGINRARRTVYQALSQFRHRRNSAPAHEPRPEEIY